MGVFEPLVPAAAVAAAAAPAEARRAAFDAVCGEDGELLADVRRAAIGAVALAAHRHELLEMGLALHADELVDWHASIVRDIVPPMERLAQLLLSWVVNALVLAGVAWLLNGVTFDNRKDLVIAAAVFGILNSILKPLAKILTLPLAIVTLGIAWFFVAMLMLWLTTVIVSGFHINGFWNYVWATIIVWALNLVLDNVLAPWRGRGRSVTM